MESQWDKAKKEFLELYEKEKKLKNKIEVVEKKIVTRESGNQRRAMSELDRYRPPPSARPHYVPAPGRPVSEKDNDNKKIDELVVEVQRLNTMVHNMANELSDIRKHGLL